MTQYAAQTCGCRPTEKTTPRMIVAWWVSRDSSWTDTRLQFRSSDLRASAANPCILQTGCSRKKRQRLYLFIYFYFIIHETNSLLNICATTGIIKPNFENRNYNNAGLCVRIQLSAILLLDTVQYCSRKTFVSYRWIIQILHECVILTDNASVKALTLLTLSSSYRCKFFPSTVNTNTK